MIASSVATGVATRNAREAQDQAKVAREEAGRADDNAGLINRTLGRLVERVAQDRQLRAAGLTAFRNDLVRQSVAM